MRDAVWDFAEHVASAQLANAPPAAVARAKTLLLDTLGVGVVGSAAPWVDAVYEAQAVHGGDARAGTARVLASGRRLPAPAAALANGFQIHNSEFDCVHDAAVVHPMTVIMGAMTAYADATGGINGRDFLTAAILGVDVAAGLGVASKAPLKFFRPATAGGLAAAAVLARLKGLDAAGVQRAISVAYGQLGGTMQAHTEGMGLLAMQIGFNARNALLAVELAAHGVDAPENVLEGPYGYFANFEGAHDVRAVAATLGRTWRIAEVSHKPFPTGRAAHGLVDAALTLRQAHGFTAEDVAEVAGRVPSLTHRLIGRPPHAGMSPNHARLSGRYAIATALITGGVGVADFGADALADPQRLALAASIDIDIDDNPDPNALAPVELTVTLKDGRRLQQRLEAVYGSPARPMSEAAHLAKFRQNFAAARPVVPADRAESLIGAVAHIETVADMRSVIDLCVAPDAAA